MPQPASIVRGLLALAAVSTPALAQGHPHGTHRADEPLTLYTNLGNLHYPITTSAPMAQAYFDQGLRFYWAFNHEASIRAFQEAERLDPRCAMCAAGQALALGPNINAPMEAAAATAAWETAQRAAQLAADNSEERALTAALLQRYDPARPREAADSAWARAIAVVADAYPSRLDLQALAAEALMDLSPWRYWTPEGEARPDTPQILARLDAILVADSNHPGGCHLLIHAVEAHDPARAVACAERLASQMPGAGHLVHMPAHIYIRLGRYDDAIRMNEHAVEADEHFFEGPAASEQTFYSLAYYPHNWHFLSFAASMAGQSGTALRAARRTVQSITPEVAREVPSLEPVGTALWTTLVTFGQWDAILKEPMPPADLRILTGTAFYARGMAFSARRRWAEARAALDSVRTIARSTPDGDTRIAMQIAALALEGEVLMRTGRARAAVPVFQQAVVLEDGLAYTEPPTWYYPMRQSLGKAQLLAGDAKAAEQTYREDLRRFPGNGWSLQGLKLSLERQGRVPEARAVGQELATAWRQIEPRPAGSRF